MVSVAGKPHVKGVSHPNQIEMLMGGRRSGQYVSTVDPFLSLPAIRPVLIANEIKAAVINETLKRNQTSRT